MFMSYNLQLVFLAYFPTSYFPLFSLVPHPFPPPFSAREPLIAAPPYFVRGASPPSSRSVAGFRRAPQDCLDPVRVAEPMNRASHSWFAAGTTLLMAISFRHENVPEFTRPAGRQRDLTCLLFKARAGGSTRTPPAPPAAWRKIGAQDHGLCFPLC